MSKGIVFLFTVMPTSSNAASAIFPVMPKERRFTRSKWLSVPPETMSTPSATSASDS